MTTTLLGSAQDTAYAARDRFNHGAGATLDLDAQPIHDGDPEETVVYTDNTDWPQEVATFATLSDLAEFAELLEGMDPLEVHHHIADLIIEAGDREATLWGFKLSAAWNPIPAVPLIEGVSR